jgi:hypothetical protein
MMIDIRHKFERKSAADVTEIAQLIKVKVQHNRHVEFTLLNLLDQ